jgi:hypothetical protein
MGLMKFFVIAVIGVFFGAKAHAQDADSGDAATLVRAMRADVVLFEASKSALSRATSEGHYTAAQFQCFQKRPPSVFVAELAQLLTRELSRDEIKEALAFYNSIAGAKFVDYEFEMLKKEHGESFTAKPVDAKPPMTTDEMRAILEFSNTAVGIRLTKDMLLMYSAEARAITERVFVAQLAACGAKIPG